jgi:TonB family protein
MTEAKVQGALDKEVVRRIVRRHINEIRFCYDQALVHNRELQGRLLAQFTVGPEGRVLAAVVSPGIGDLRMDGCITQAIRRWEFPQPSGGGLVVARYPFSFSTP